MDDKNIRYVAHLDILGMSTIVEKDLDEAWGLLSDLVDIKDRYTNDKIGIEFIETKETIRIREQIQTVIFSDTIILFTKSNTPMELRCIIILLSEIFHQALFRCVPIRAGLSVGKFYFNTAKSMYVGPALIEAYCVGETSQWLGITLGQSVQEEAVELQMKSRKSDVIVNWDVPLRKGKQNSYVINWPAIFSDDLKIDPPVSVEQFYQAFQNTFGMYDTLPKYVRSKYTNTVSFMNTQLKQHFIA